MRRFILASPHGEPAGPRTPLPTQTPAVALSHRPPLRCGLSCGTAPGLLALPARGAASRHRMPDQHAILSGSGRIVVHATNTLHASVPGSGIIAYSGPAHVTTNITGSGAVTRQ